MASFATVYHAFLDGWHSGVLPKPEQFVRKDKAMRDHMSESQIDKMIRDSFPASDPPSTY